jgi:hypothetical protein
MEFTISLKATASVSGGEFFQRSSGLNANPSSFVKSGKSGNSEPCKSTSFKKDEGSSLSDIAERLDDVEMSLR